MAFTKGKGTVGAVEISSVYTAIPQAVSIKKSGEGSETFQARTIDGLVHSLQPNTGYAGNPTFDLELYWDSQSAVHVFLKTSLRTPPAAGVNFKLTDTGATPVVEIWNITGIEVNEEYTTDDGVKAQVKLTTSGNNS